MKQLVTLPMAALLLLSSAGEAGAQWKSEQWQSGEAALLPLGVHFANGRQGSYGYALAASTGIAALGLALAFNTADPYRGAALVSIPVAQLAASIAIERGGRQRK